MAARKTGIDASLVILRQELESMQKQDKDLHKQLLTLRESIRSLKVELKRERDECEEAFYDLQEISLNTKPTEPENGQKKFTKNQETEKALKHEKDVVEESNIKDQCCKHDRQDSGISVKNCDAEASADPVRNGITSKPAIIHHSKQDSGILIDEDAMIETQLLSRLVQSSSGTFSRHDFRKLMHSHDRWRQVDEDGLSDNKPSQCKSNKDLNTVLQRPLKDWSFCSRSLLTPKHSRSRSCPSASTKRLSQEFRDNKVVPSHHTRPSQRSASVVDLESLNEIKENDGTDAPHSTENESHFKMTAAKDVERMTGKDQQLRAVLVSAGEVNISNINGSLVSREGSLAGAKSTEVKCSQRRFTLAGSKPERRFYDSENRKDFHVSSPSFQFPKNRTRQRKMPESDMRRRGSMHVWHTSSKSWDGNMGRPRERYSLLRSTSQVSLV